MFAVGLPRTATVLYCVWSILELVSIGYAEPNRKLYYRGCYLSQRKSSLLNDAVHNSTSPMTSDSCVEFCRQKNFPFAGVEKHECRCGRHVPSDLLKRSDSECHYVCPGNKTAMCGGKSKFPVFETGIKIHSSNSIPTRIYLGCFKDADPEFRVLKGSNIQFPIHNTPQKCHQHCFNSGFQFFGLTYMKECFCGDTIPSLTDGLSESECNSPCTGDVNEMCGGGWRLSLYSTGITDLPEVGRLIGCFKNLRNSEIKYEFKIELPKSNTNRRCLNMCDFKGYKYAGVENKTQCICTNAAPHSIFLDENRYGCDKTECPGDPTEKCGATNRIKIFQTRRGDTTHLDEVIYMGCYKDRTDFRVLNGYKISVEGDLSAKLCADNCRNKGFAFSGLETGKECYCSHTYPSGSLRTLEDECTIPCDGNPNERCGGFLRIAVYQTGLPHNHARVSSLYLGCFKDDDKENRLLKGSWQQLENNSPDVCHRLCLKTGFQYFGLTWIKECFCGDENIPDNQNLRDDECNKACGGDSNKKCGGGWKLSVYRTGLEDLPDKNEYLGCFQDDGGLLPDYSVLLYSSNKPKRCVRICDQMGYLYAGVKQGDACHCGNDQPKILAQDEEKCNFKCPGAIDETCGANNYIRIYRTTVQVASSSQRETPVFNVDVLAGQCKISDTTIGGQSVCKYQLIFDETFDNINTSRWRHTVKMASDPDYEFVTYSSSSKITFVKNGILHIKPTLHPDEDYVQGTETLSGCTGTANSDECTRTASAFNILPPIASGQITTARSFSFRFGRIDIRAKLPSGDWIIPQLWLTPKESIYGPNYISGQIRIALARGNKHLQCGESNMGGRILESGVLVGPVNSIQKVIRKNETADEWSKKFHNFSLVWTTDNLSFYVDGKFISHVLGRPSDTVLSVAKLPHNARYIWQDGSKLAPFDKEFYITVGVSVGGVKEFPDDCLSNGKKKPWSNTSPKAMFNFWAKRHEWSATWSPDNAVLQVDHIKVAAI